jgi:CubicO group peptidase (beta-lactamase class C family)
VQQSFGLARLSDVPCTRNTIFDLGSCSKSTTAAAVALLVQDNIKYPNVQWETPVSELLPEEFVMNEAEHTRLITVEDILSHRTGLPCHDDSVLLGDDAKTITRNLRNLVVNKGVREEYQYSNIMYTVASYLVETVSGVTYSEFIKSKIWERLEMTDTWPDLPSLDEAAEGVGEARGRLATGYQWDERSGEYVAIPSVASPEGQGAGCVFSTAADYAKWLRCLLQHIPPLSPIAHKAFVAPRITVPVSEGFELPFYSKSHYALGLVTETYRDHTVIGHDGDMTGFKTLVRYLPEWDWGVVICGNSDGAFYATQIIFHYLVDELLKIPKRDQIDWLVFWRQWCERELADEEDDEEDLRAHEQAEPLGVPLDSLVGTYHNAGYHELVLETKYGELLADCNDRCFGFVLTFKHLSGKRFEVTQKDSLSGEMRKMGAEIKVSKEGKVGAVGIGFVKEMEGYLVWFDRVE